MSKRKAEVVEEYDDYEEEEIPTNKKQPPLRREDRIVCELSKEWKVVVRKLKGKLYVDIREFYHSGGVAFPSKKGMALTLDQWKVLKAHLEAIQDLLQECDSDYSDYSD